LAANTAISQSIFVAARLNGTENDPQKPRDLGNVGLDEEEL
jgi:hypothetical protein